LSVSILPACDSAAEESSETTNRYNDNELQKETKSEVCRSSGVAISINRPDHDVPSPRDGEQGEGIAHVGFPSREGRPKSKQSRLAYRYCKAEEENEDWFMNFGKAQTKIGIQVDRQQQGNHGDGAFVFLPHNFLIEFFRISPGDPIIRR
jgi:hypothetical protein